MIATPTIGSKTAPRDFLNRSLKLFMATAPRQGTPFDQKKNNTREDRPPKS